MQLFATLTPPIVWDDGEFVTLRSAPTPEGRPVLAITPTLAQPAPASIASLERAYAIRAELDPTWAACPTELIRQHGRLMLLNEDPGGELLARTLGEPWELGAFLRVAIGMTSALGQLHRRGLIHRDIKPGNVIVNTETGQAWLTGFGLASRLTREGKSPEPPDVIAGTLAYMSPEQTGRMNRSVDSRSDLYSLGITFYQMLTGALPFAASDPMEWIHCHIARQPTSPSERAASIPEPVAAIIIRLLAKTAEERYQTAHGLESDLRHCLAEWKSNGCIDPFPLSVQDVSDRLDIQEKLYGREREIATLLAAFERVADEGTVELVVVSGYSGIGKSSVVNELQKVVAPTCGLFAPGKFDQYKRDIPYATVAQAFQPLVRQILAQSEGEVNEWKGALNEALGLNGQLILNLIPEVEFIIGKQPPVPDLAPYEAQNRIQTVLRRFLDVFTRQKQAFVLFLDDLQWADAATLQLIDRLVLHPDVRRLLLVVAYRDNEIRTDHPLMQMLDVIRTAGARMHEITLAPLGLADILQLVSDATHSATDRVVPLAELVFNKTNGNPFFAVQFATSLADENLLTFDPESNAWLWDIERIRAKDITDNVVDLMVGKLHRLPVTAQKALESLACLGHSAQITTLSMVLGTSDEEAHAALREAARAELVIRGEEIYSFSHDRVQEAAYSLIPQGERAATHLQIGRTLESHMRASEREDTIFEVVNQFNRAHVLIELGEKRSHIAELNLLAGGRARASAAYTSAIAYLTAGCALLPGNCWEQEYDLTFALKIRLAECEFLNFDLNVAEGLILDALQHGVSKFDRAAAYKLKIDLHVMRSEHSQAIETAVACLGLFDIDLSPHPPREHLDRAYAEIRRRVDGRTIESLVDLPRLTNPEVEAAMTILATMYAPAIFTDEILASLHLCHMVLLTLKHGVTGASAHGLGSFGIVLGHVYGRYADGYKFTLLARELVARHQFIANEAMTLWALEIVSLWTCPPAVAIEAIRASYRSALETGDLLMACYACNHLITDLLLRGDHLDDIWAETDRCLAFARRAGFRDVVDVLISQRRFIQNLRGRTKSFSSFDGDDFIEAHYEELLAPDRATTMICWYWIIKAQARFHSGQFDEAQRLLERAKPLLWSSPGHIQLLDYHLYSALTAAALESGFQGRNAAARRAKIAAHCDELAQWAKSCPATFADKHALIGAEIARLDNETDNAMRLYEEAIHLAHENGFVQNEGIANEFASRFYAARGFKTIADAYLRNARICYQRWGAEGKVRQLDKAHPHLRHEPVIPRPDTTIGESLEHLDLATVVKVSQAVLGEISLEKLIDTVMVMALKNAGGDRGLLILSRGEELRIEAEAVTVRDTIEVRHRSALVTSADLPESILRFVIRTQSSVILDDASAPNQFSTDEYILQMRTRSALCLPLVKQGKLIGALYLENNLASRVFTAARINVLHMLVAQAAISLENALLYTELLESEDHLRIALDTIPTMAWVCSKDGVAEVHNKRWLDFTGLTIEQSLGGGWRDALHPDDLTRVMTYFRGLLASGEAGQIEHRMRRFDGEYRWILTRFAPSRDKSGKPVKWYGTNSDIEDRKRGEEAIRASERNLRLIIDTIPGQVWCTTPDGEIDFVNERFLRYAGVNVGELDGQGWKKYAHPDDLELTARKWSHSVATGQRFEAEYRRRQPDGVYQWFKNVGEPLRDSGGRIIRWYGLLVNIEDRKNAEQALESTQVRLSRAMQLATAGELTASIAHEVSQPLAAVLSNAEASLQWLSEEGLNLANARRDVERIVRDASDAGEVISRVRALFKRSAPAVAPVNLNEIVVEVVRLLQNEIEKRHIILEAELDENLPLATGDRVQVQQVMLNLLLNGIEAMDTVIDRPKKLCIRSKRESAGTVMVEVRDYGIGLKNSERIFESFFTTKENGIGMGLSICRSILTAHQGRLWTASCEGPGAKFCFALPVVSQSDPKQIQIGSEMSRSAG